MKPCIICHQIKDLSEFGKKRQAKDGHESRCKACMREIQRTYRASPAGRAACLEATRKYRSSERGRKTRKAHSATPEQRAARHAYNHTEKGKQVHDESRRRRRQTELGKLKGRAEKAVRRAIERGDLPPVKTLSCSVCGEIATAYHHDLGYAEKNWLHVAPVCTTCHMAIHYP